MAQASTLDPKEIVHRLCEKTSASAGAESAVQPQKAEIVTKPTGAKPPLHALIIGINKYKANVHLAAAVPDALTFKDYLMNDLAVPEDQITIILDEQCKRADIIKAFQDLASPDNTIQRGDPIVIYYAGHGSELNPPPDRAANGPQVQCIIPQDTSKDDGVVPIPDFTIGTLVHRIAREKGNNITLIFDCCHSAGGSRDTPENARYIDKANLPALPASPDKNIIDNALSGSRDIVDPTSLGLSFEGMDSHVLLAACGHGEVAFENGAEGHGYFSSALLKLLRSVKVDSLTYKGFMQRLPPLRTRQPQNPVCEGRNMDRVFFNAKVPGASTSFIAIKPDKSNQFYLQAGLIQGITPGSKFAIHESDIPGPNNPSLGTLEIDKVDPFVSHLKDADTLNLPPLTYGVQVSYGPNQGLDVYITPEFVDAAEPDDGWAEAFAGNKDQLILRPVEREMASIIVSANADKKAVFTIGNQVSVQHGIENLPPPTYDPVPPIPRRVIPVLTSFAQWSWHLSRMPESRPFKEKIDFEMYKLQLTGNFTDEGNQILEPEGENLNKDGVVEVLANDENYYGIRVVNRSNSDLYANMLSFSCTSLAIESMNVPIIGSNATDPTLPKNQEFTIGYGSGGQMPLMFELREITEPKPERMDFDVAFLKLFVSNKPADLTSLEQETPFEGRGMASNSTIKQLFAQQPLWDAFTLKLIQRRFPKEETQADATESTPADAGPTLYTGRSEEGITAQARSAAAMTEPWFRTPVLTKELISSIHHMQLRTFAKQQGPAGATATAQTGAYFEVSVIGSDDLPKLTSPDAETTMTYRSHAAPATSDYEWTDGMVFDENHELWSKLEEGDCFEVTVCARGRGWKNDADQGHLTFW